MSTKKWSTTRKTLILTLSVIEVWEVNEKDWPVNLFIVVSSHILYYVLCVCVHVTADGAWTHASVTVAVQYFFF